VGAKKIKIKAVSSIKLESRCRKLGLPTCVHFISHVDYGSSGADLGHVNKIINETKKSDRSGILILNGMLASDVPRREDREDILDEFADKMGEIPKQRRMGVMLDSILRDDAWNRGLIK